MKIRLTGYIEVPAPLMDAVRRALIVHIEQTRLEAGFLLFEVSEDESELERFNVTEEFDSRAAFEFHQKRTQTSEWATAKGLTKSQRFSLWRFPCCAV